MEVIGVVIFMLGIIMFFVGVVGVLGSLMDEEIKVTIICGIIGVVGVGLLIFYVSVSLKCEDKPWTIESEPYSIEYIEALSDSSMMSGRFYVRSGYIEEQAYYQYMVRQSDGGFVYNRVKARTAKIYYTDDDNYRVEWYRRTKNFLFASQEEVLQKIYVPKGSIEDGFNIDLN